VAKMVGGMLTDYIHDRDLRAVCIVHIREAIGETRPKME